ncbi:hypothetical protein P691DRAFT_708557 [Macrolepiota fuliginosa MF-IS2]|uniref:Pyruvate carboxylase n=1 Tax=Macrolepiota fuliginosa MF-IS2 TaxID=1400762 RepID=A0A9P6C0C3_9AGAR|nr:hypothetical protein P691DRAFT_708557 [Macrolepiota fuliginosa MF-IS2]
MNVDAIVEIAVRTQCTHVHPGYGFLSESPALASALAQLSPPITFIGPSPDTLRLAGDKTHSRDLATSLNVQVAPGTRVTVSEEVCAFAARHGVGYPIMIKALDGGGGRGIRVVETASRVDEAFKRCLGESPSGKVFVEKALTGPGWKHIEIQIMGDGAGAVNHFWERECSVQRRFQKIVEVAPSRLPRPVLQPLIDASLKIAAHLKYKGLGTFEFLVNSSTYQWVFLEINPRVQVEHTITEEIMDLDLVQVQLLLFSSSASTNTLSSLFLDNPPPVPTSTAIQLRLTAENPENGFLLTPGIIRSSDLQWPAGRGVRIDTWLSSSAQPPSEWVVGTDFDSLLAKIIVRGHSFEEASRKGLRALREFKLAKDSKIKTNLRVLSGVLDHQDWKDGSIDTLWLERSLASVLDLSGKVIGGRAGLGTDGLDELLKQRASETSSTITTTPSPGGNALLQPGTLFHLTLSPTSSSVPATTSQEARKHTLTLTSIAHNAFPEKLSGVLQSTLSPSPLAFSLSQSTSAAVGGSGEGFELADPNDPQHVAAPLTGKIVDICPTLKLASQEQKEGDDGGRQRVKKGETLVVMSVMKMESVVVAPHDGIVERVGKGLKVGVILGEGMLVCVVRPLGASRL